MSRTARILRRILQHTRLAAAFPTAAIVFTFACIPVHAALPAAAPDAGPSRKPTLEFSSCAKPRYPQDDLQARHEGTVTVGFLVDATGRVLDARVAESSGFASLDDAARTALAQCSFQPALEHGKPVEQWTMVKYVWTLR